jgi:plasmid stabilization system protein ParE
MSSFALHPEAYDDLDELRAYIAEDSPDAADRMVNEIFDRLMLLAEFPDQGFRRPPIHRSAVSFHFRARIPDRLRAGAQASLGSGCHPRSAQPTRDSGDSSGAGVGG